MPRRKKDAITGKPRPDWIAIKAMYLAGTKFCDLAKEFKVPEGTIKSRAYRFKWLGGEMSPRVIKKVQTQIEKTATENIEQLRRDRSLQVREAEYKAAQRILDFAEEMEYAELRVKRKEASRMSRLNFEALKPRACSTLTSVMRCPAAKPRSSLARL